MLLVVSERQTKTSLVSFNTVSARQSVSASRKQLSWSGEAEGGVLSGRRSRDTRILESIQPPQESTTPSVSYEDVCDGIACYKIEVTPRDEELVAQYLQNRISSLASNSPSGDRKKPFVSAWAPIKRVRTLTKHGKLGVGRRVKYGMMEGEIVFLECQMNQEIFDLVMQYPSVQRFTNLHPLNKKVPLPCTDSEKQDVHDWLWNLEDPQKTMQQEKQPAVEIETQQPYEDIAFAVDQLNNNRYGALGFETVFDPRKEKADEVGEKWKQKQKRQNRRAQRQKTRSFKQEEKITRRPLKPRSFQREQKRIEPAEEAWFDDSTVQEIDSEPEEKQKKDSKSIVITEGPFTDYRGEIIKESNGNFTVMVDVFGEKAEITVNSNDFRFENEKV